MNENPKVSLLITLATPHYGFPKLSSHFESLLKHIFEPEAVDVLSQDKGVYSTIYTVSDQKKFLKLTMINVQGSLKRLAGGDGIIKPEPVSEMINIVEPRTHFHIHKSHLVFNDLIKFLSQKTSIYKIQLLNIKFPSVYILHPIYIYFKISINNKIEQRYPIEGEVTVSSNETTFKFPQVIYTGYSEDSTEKPIISIEVFRKKLLLHELLLKESFYLDLEDGKTISTRYKLQNQIVNCNFIIVSYKLGKEY